VEIYAALNVFKSLQELLKHILMHLVKGLILICTAENVEIYKFCYNYF